MLTNQLNQIISHFLFFAMDRNAISYTYLLFQYYFHKNPSCISGRWRYIAPESGKRNFSYPILKTNGGCRYDVF